MVDVLVDLRCLFFHQAVICNIIQMFLDDSFLFSLLLTQSTWFGYRKTIERRIETEAVSVPWAKHTCCFRAP